MPFGGAAGEIGEPVADGFDPTPETEGPGPDEPVPVGNGAPVPVANPVEPATPEELRIGISIEFGRSFRGGSYLMEVVLVHEQTVS